MHSLEINGEEVRGQPANPGSPGKMAIKMECVCDSFVQVLGRAYQGTEVPWEQVWPDALPAAITSVPTETEPKITGHKSATVTTEQRPLL